MEVMQARIHGRTVLGGLPGGGDDDVSSRSPVSMRMKEMNEQFA